MKVDDLTMKRAVAIHFTLILFHYHTLVGARRARLSGQIARVLTIIPLQNVVRDRQVCAGTDRTAHSAAVPASRGPSAAKTATAVSASAAT